MAAFNLNFYRTNSDELRNPMYRGVVGYEMYGEDGDTFTVAVYRDHSRHRFISNEAIYSVTENLLGRFDDVAPDRNRNVRPRLSAFHTPVIDLTIDEPLEFTYICTNKKNG